MFFYHLGFLSNLCLPWNFSLYWIYFLHSGFLNNLRLPWKTECALNSLTECIFFIIQDFWATCACAESCPEIFHCFEIFFIIQEFWATCACPENRDFPENFHWFEIFFIIQEFRATCAYSENRICSENFQAGERKPPRLVRLWACGIEDENTIFYIAWKMTISMNKPCVHWMVCPCLVTKLGVTITTKVEFTYR